MRGQRLRRLAALLGAGFHGQIRTGKWTANRDSRV